MSGRFSQSKKKQDFKKLLLVCCCLWISQYVFVHADVNTNDDKYRVMVVGAWEEDPHVAPYGVSYFYNGGAYEGKMFNNILKTRLLMTAKGKWWINKGKLYNTIDLIEPSVISIPKYPYIDVIVDISSSVMTLIDEQGNKYFKYKLTATTSGH